MEKDYYTAEEAAKVLGIPHTTFHREVTAGRIPYEIEVGKKRGRRFPKEAIDAHALLKRAKEKEHLEIQFLHATNADIWQAIQNAKKVYGEEDSTPYRKVLKWREINDTMTMSMKSGERFLGYTTFLPLDENIILSLMRGQIREKHIPIKAIKKWTEPALSVYIANIAVVPSGNPNSDRERGSFLLRRTIKWAISLMHQYDIRKWYAIATTNTDQGVCKALGFEEILSVENGIRKGYVLKDIRQPAKLLQMFLATREESANAEKT